MTGPYLRATNIVHTFGTDGSESIRIASSDAQLIEAELDAFGTLSFRMRGRPPQGEQESDAAAWVLVERLNQYGGNWTTPERMPGPERGVDFLARDGHTELHIQITRAFSDRAAWRELALEGDVTRKYQIDDAVAKLWQTILQKAARIATTARSSIVLGLSTAMPALFVPTRLMIDFKNRHAVEVQVLGFQSVWLIGPTAALTWRIDEQFPSGEPIRIGF